MMRKTVIVLSLLSALWANACEKNTVIEDTANAVPSSEVSRDKTEFSAEALLGMIANKEAVTAPEYEALLRAIERCDIDASYQLDLNCSALKALRIFDKDYVMADGVDVGAIKSKSIRSDIYKLHLSLIPQISSILGVNEDGKSLLLEIGKTTTEPSVITDVINILSKDMGDKNVADFILSHVDSKNLVVRLAVVGAVTSSHSKHVDGMIDVALRFLNDKDQDVRAYAYQEIGNLGDEKAVRALDDILRDKEQLPLHGACINSLYALWYDYPEHANTSAAAYRASIDYLKQTPRTQDFPSPTGLDKLSFKQMTKIGAWQSKADYFKAEEFVAIMRDMALDPNYSVRGRNSAIRVINTWGTIKEESKDVLLSIGKTSQDPLILKQIIDTLHHEIDDKMVSDFILSNADNASPAVRMSVAQVITTPRSKLPQSSVLSGPGDTKSHALGKNVPTDMDVRAQEGDIIVDLAIKLLNDEDESIRKSTCRDIGNLGDKRIIQPILDILKDKKQEYRHGDCMNSLYTMWYDYPYHHTNEAAYKASMDYLKQTPRTANFPKSTGLAKTAVIDLATIADWQLKANYFDADAFLAIMRNMAADVNYDAEGRMAAIYVIGAWGAEHKDMRKFLLDIGQTSDDLMIIETVIDALSTKMDDKDVADFILSHANHRSAEIRMTVLYAVTRPQSKPVDAMIDAALKFLDDEDQDVRRKACSDLGNLANDKVIKPISDILKDKDQVYRHNECLKSLYTLWYDYPEHQHTSEAAYRASIDYLKQTPRSETFPPWASVSHLKSINKDKIKAWKSKADYFNTDEIVAVMADLASDPSYDRMGRSEAILVIGAWGTKQDLKTLKKRLSLDSNNNPDLIINFIDEAMTKKNSE